MKLPDGTIHIAAKVPLYNCAFDVYLTDDPMALSKALKLPEEQRAGEDDMALVYTRERVSRLKECKGLPSKGFGVILRPNASLDTIAHECVHVASKILHHIGAVADVENDEPYAYLVGWCVSQVERALKRR